MGIRTNPESYTFPIEFQTELIYSMVYFLRRYQQGGSDMAWGYIYDNYTTSLINFTTDTRWNGTYYIAIGHQYLFQWSLVYGNASIGWQQITYTYPISFSWLYSVLNVYAPADSNRDENEIYRMQQKMSLMLVNNNSNINLKLTVYQGIYNRNIALGI